MALSRQTQPLFSIIVPTYGRPEQLADCLQALARLRFPREQFEVIVVDDGSTTPPDAVVARFCDHLDLALLTQAHAGPAAARNTGAARAQGKFLAFTDDDCLPAPDWLATLAARLATAPDHVIGGRTLNALPENPYAATSQVIVDTAYAHYNPDPNQARFFASNNLALPTDRFRAIGGFDAGFTASEDRDLCDRWLHHDCRMIYAAEVVVYHAHPLTLRTFWRQHFNYGRGAFRFHQARARRGEGPFRPEYRFYRNLLGYPFLQPRDQRRWRIAVLLVASQIANAAGFCRELAIRDQRRQPPNRDALDSHRAR